MARQYGLAAGTVRVIDRWHLERWTKKRKKPALRQMVVDEIYLGKTQRFLTVVSNLETCEPLWFGSRIAREETLDEFFTAACVDMWEPLSASIVSWPPECRIVYDKFHVMHHAGKAVDEVGWPNSSVEGAECVG